MTHLQDFFDANARFSGGVNRLRTVQSNRRFNLRIRGQRRC